ncbi:hypothetical protein NL108_017436 [Boleophthalmus pectinirostris]|nr:hypothetical protein NL108_017436 [Boleophthalmus pectinirostris]
MSLFTWIWSQVLSSTLSFVNISVFVCVSNTHQLSVKVHCVTFLLEGPSNTFLHGDVIALSGMFHSMVLNPFCVHGDQTRPSDRSDLWRGDPSHSHNVCFSRYF